METTANKITILRILSVPFFIVAVLYYSPANGHLRWIALGIFTFAVLTDMLDGYLARQPHQRSKGGAILDPLADKILLISAFVCLYSAGINFPNVRFPLWIVVVMISRDMILILGAIVIQMIHGSIQISPTLLGKLTTFFQILSIYGVLLQWIYSPYLWSIAVVITVISGLDYLRKGLQMLNHGEEAK
jgi:CDP-diacylglycerol--glycerol-3-phosphate 3-phosphatidyltransferase